MKYLRFSFVVFAAALLIMGMSGVASAFHSGGVGECIGCHSMHEARSGALLIGGDPSSTCLNCHMMSAGVLTPSSFHVATNNADLVAGAAPTQRTPGGDFGWLRKDYTFILRGAEIFEPGERHGHNIVATDYGYAADTEHPTAPGGVYPSSLLACNSCHDQHGKYRRLGDGTIATTGAPIIASGSYHNSPDPVMGESAVGVYRLLAGIGWITNGVSFTVNSPAAAAPATYNRTESTTQTRVAYGRGMSEWCAQCHPDMHTNSGRLVHPVSQNLGSRIQGIYNSYVKSGDMTGTQATSYLSLVPYEENTMDYTALKALASTSATTPLPGPPGPTVQVMCLSCHRTHATGWEEMTRWNNEGEFIVYNGFWPGTDTTPTLPQFHRGRTSAETQAAYYDRAPSTFATYQRVLCNKCHAQD